jgi:transposase
MADRSWRRACHPVKVNRKVPKEHDRRIHRQRNIVKPMFCRFKDWRRVATRFDRNIRTFVATITIAAFATWCL